MAALVEAALLHDIGKTRIPLDIVKKPGALDRRERKLIEAHTTLGAEILVQIEGLRPLTPVVALEHHRGVTGTGYPDLGDAVPHFMSQIVSVADIYEAITGARSYQDPTPPEHACLILARLAGQKLNANLVKAFVNAITFFPIGCVVRTNRDEIGDRRAHEPRRPASPHPGARRPQPEPVGQRGHQHQGRVRELRAAHPGDAASSRWAGAREVPGGGLIYGAWVLSVFCSGLGALGVGFGARPGDKLVDPWGTTCGSPRPL